MNQQYLFLILLAVAFVALIVLPGRQRKRQQAQTQAMQDALQPGTKVMTTSGIHGTVSRIGDTTIDVEIAPGVPVTFERRAIMQVTPPAAPTGTGLDQPGIDQPGIDTPGIDQPGIDQPGIDQPGIDQAGIDQPGFDQHGDGTPGDGAGGPTR